VSSGNVVCLIADSFREIRLLMLLLVRKPNAEIRSEFCKWWVSAGLSLSLFPSVSAGWCGLVDALELTMLLSGFFGIPAEDQYNLEVMVESPGYNCTLAPYLQVTRCLSREPVLQNANTVKTRLYPSVQTTMRNSLGWFETNRPFGRNTFSKARRNGWPYRLRDTTLRWRMQRI
jgi:hypothetical protein